MKTKVELDRIAELDRIDQERMKSRLIAMRELQSLADDGVHNPAPVQETIHADDEDELHAIIMNYKEQFSKEAWYEEPTMQKNGHVSLSFKDEETAMAFAKAQAEAGHTFIMMDTETGKVIGYSDGKAFHENTDNKSLEDLKSELDWPSQSKGPSMR